MNLSMKKVGLALLTSCALFISPALADELADGFQNPPNSARPRVWWHWMNGNVTIDGIEKDFEWMKRVGIGGVQNFDANLATPQIVKKRLVFMDPDWKAAFKYAVSSAEQKGLEFAIAASPGWSETGGPWVKPEEGMKKLVWSETVVPGGKRYSGKLAALPTKTGPFGTIGTWDPIAGITGANAAPPPVASGTIGAFAVPISAAPLVTPKAMLDDGSPLAAPQLFDGDANTALDMKPQDGNVTPIILDYGKPVTVRSATLSIIHGKPPFGEPAYTPVLEADFGGNWKRVESFIIGETPSTISFTPVTAQRFRIRFSPYEGKKRINLGREAPGAESFDLASMLKGRKVEIGEITLSGETRVHQGEEKAGFGAAMDFYEIARNSKDKAKPAAIDVSSFVKPDGTLDWKAPKGSNWRVYSMGWSLTGKTNHPATAEATGLEVDKFDAEAVRRYMQTYIGMYRDTVGADLIGKKGIKALLTDSIEVGFSNWTPKMPQEFKVRRGYDLLPWMPALAGEVIGSEAETEKFLYDYRKTLGELLVDNHYGAVAKVARENGMIVYGEALEDSRPTLGDDLAMRKYANIPMAALWTWTRDTSPRTTLLGDMKGAASVAHVYGQNLVAAESMTSAASPWAFAPKDLKRIIDLEFAYGINRPVIHTSVHQPSDDKKPGLSLMIFGQYFNRHDAWAEMAKPWVDYMSRSAYMLQQGRNHADVAVFIGEESPITAQHAYGLPEGYPKTYAFDFVNADMLANAISVEGTDIVARGGARYKAIFLHGSSQMMTLSTLKRLATMVDAGAVLIGQKPHASPALLDDAAEFAAIADRLWKHRRVIASNDVESSMAKAGFEPDFTYRGMNNDTNVLFVHRKLSDGEVYWVNNRANRAEKVSMSFRVTGKAPELWNPITGKSRFLGYTTEGNSTRIDMEMGPEEAAFLVFRKHASATQALAIRETPTPKILSTINNEWEIRFQEGRGAPALSGTKILKPLNEHSDSGIKYFSGVATYTTGFALPTNYKAGSPLLLDLGEVGDVAEVLVNGQAAGTVWFAPYRVDVSKFVKIGVNKLEIRVANTWVNRLIGDKQPGAKPVAFVAAPTYKPSAPLRPAGLIGPVTLVSE